MIAAGPVDAKVFKTAAAQARLSGETELCVHLLRQAFASADSLHCSFATAQWPAPESPRPVEGLSAAEPVPVQHDAVQAASLSASDLLRSTWLTASSTEAGQAQPAADAACAESMRSDEALALVGLHL